MDKNNNGNQDHISKESNYTTIFEFIVPSAEFNSLIEFYLYRMANSSDSPLSYKIDASLTKEQKDTLFSRLLTSIDVSETDFGFDGPFLKNNIGTISKMKLGDKTLEFDRIKGFFHQNKSNEKPSQHKLDAMFKHIRDSFAHGRVGRMGEYLILEDKKKELTARLIITLDALYTWKREILSYLNLDSTENDK